MRYLLAASVGPVQGFIAASRKTRDLYAGSWILSEVAKAVAKSLHDTGGQLVFPAPGGDLSPRSALTVSNKILAIVETESPQTLAAGLRESAISRLRELCGDLDKPFERDFEHDKVRLLQHVEGMLEFYAAWIPSADGDDYGARYEQVQGLLDARKLTRNFAAHMGVAGLPKSSLDGMRESILARPAQRNQSESARIRVALNEELDGAGFLKRFVRLDGIRFESVKKIAESPYRGRIKPGDDLYYAILMADGDRMGESIGGMSMADQQEISRWLSGFAITVKEKLEELDCMPVFTGGDELIAMIPLHRLIEALDAVHTIFQGVKTGDRPLTISAGVAIVHAMEPLDEAREMAEEAKRLAKDRYGRNSLCIREAPRSGAPVQVGGAWDWMLPTLREVGEAYVGKTLSYGFGHEMYDLLERTPKELEETLPKLAMAVALHKGEGNSAAPGLVDRNQDRLDELVKLMLVARRPAAARRRWSEGAATA